MLNKAGHMSKTMPNFCMEGLTFQFGQHLDILMDLHFLKSAPLPISWLFNPVSLVFFWN